MAEPSIEAGPKTCHSDCFASQSLIPRPNTATNLVGKGWTMSSNQTLTEDDTTTTIRDPSCDDKIHGDTNEDDRERASSLVKEVNSITVNGVVELQSDTATNTTTGNPKPSDSSDGDSKAETSLSVPVVHLTVNSQSPSPSVRHNQSEAYREKDAIPTTNEDSAGQHPSTTTQSITMSNSRFPPPLFCPLTRRLFQDPVVAPDGHTYERDVLLQRDHQGYLTAERLYPNRALQQILDEEPRHPLLEQLWENSLWPPDRPLPDAYYCPITFELMHVPVIDPEGNTYEKAAIVHWLRVNGHSPISRSPLTVTQLYPNHVVRELLEYHANDKPNHAALSKWKSDPAPSVPEPSDMPIYPSTFEELEAHHARMRRQRRKVIACTILGVVCLILAIVGAASYGGYCIFISIWLGCCVRDSCRRLRELRYEHHQERLSLEEAQQRVEALHARLRQLQQQEEEDLRRLTTESNGPQFHSLPEVMPSDQPAMPQPPESAPPMTDQQEPSVQLETLNQQETQQRIEGDIHEQSQPSLQPTLSITHNHEQILQQQDEEPEVDLEEGIVWPTTTLPDPSLTANDSSSLNYDPLCVTTVNLSAPMVEDFYPNDDDDVELGPVDISVGPPTTTSSKD